MSQLDTFRGVCPDCGRTYGKNSGDRRVKAVAQTVEIGGIKHQVPHCDCDGNKTRLIARIKRHSQKRGDNLE